MGRRGPKPTPTAVKQARGTFRADRAPANEPKASGKPTCPSWLTDKDARAEFRRVARMLTDMGVVGAADTNLITRYCMAWVRWRKVSQTLVANPSAEVAVYKDTDGKLKAMQVSALHSIARSLSEELGRAEAALGMTPSSRSRMEVAAPAAPAAETPAKSKSRFFDGSHMRIAQ